ARLTIDPEIGGSERTRSRDGAASHRNQLEIGRRDGALERMELPRTAQQGIRERLCRAPARRWLLVRDGDLDAAEERRLQAVDRAGENVSVLSSTARVPDTDLAPGGWRGPLRSAHAANGLHRQGG